MESRKRRGSTDKQIAAKNRKLEADQPVGRALTDDGARGADRSQDEACQRPPENSPASESAPAVVQASSDRSSPDHESSDHPPSHSTTSSDQSPQTSSEQSQKKSSHQSPLTSSDQLESRSTEQTSSDQPQETSSEQPPKTSSDKVEPTSTEETSSEQPQKTSSDQSEPMSAEQTPSDEPPQTSDQTQQTSSDQTQQTSSDQTPCTSSDEPPQTSSDQTSQTSSDQTPGTSSDWTPQTSSDQSEPMSAEQTPSDEPPQTSDQTQQTSSDQTQQTSSDQTQQTSSDQSQQTSSDQSQQTSSDQAPGTSSDQSQQTSSDQSQQTASDQTPGTSSDQSQQTSDQSQQTASNQTPGTSSDQTPGTSSDHASQIRKGRLLASLLLSPDCPPADDTHQDEKFSTERVFRKLQEDNEKSPEPGTSSAKPPTLSEPGPSKKYYMDISAIPFYLFMDMVTTSTITVSGKDYNLTFDESLEDTILSFVHKRTVYAYFDSDEAAGSQTKESQNPDNRSGSNTTSASSSPPPLLSPSSPSRLHSQRKDDKTKNRHCDSTTEPDLQAHENMPGDDEGPASDIPPENTTTPPSSPPENCKKGGLRSKTGKHFLPRRKLSLQPASESSPVISWGETDVRQEASDDINPAEWNDPRYRHLEELKLREYRLGKGVLQTREQLQYYRRLNEEYHSKLAAQGYKGIQGQGEHPYHHVPWPTDHKDKEGDEDEGADVNENILAQGDNTHSSDSSAPLLVPKVSDTNLSENRSHQTASGSAVKRKAAHDTEDDFMTGDDSHLPVKKRVHFNYDDNKDAASSSTSRPDDPPQQTSTQPSCSQQSKPEVLEEWKVDALMELARANKFLTDEELQGMADNLGIRKDIMQTFLADVRTNIFGKRTSGTHSSEQAEVSAGPPVEREVTVQTDPTVIPESDDEESSSKNSPVPGPSRSQNDQSTGSSFGISGISTGISGFQTFRNIGKSTEEATIKTFRCPRSSSDEDGENVDGQGQKGGSVPGDLNKKTTRSQGTSPPPPLLLPDMDPPPRKVKKDAKNKQEPPKLETIYPDESAGLTAEEQYQLQQAIASSLKQF